MNGLNLYDVLGWVLGLIGLAGMLVGIYSRRIIVRSTPRCSECGYQLDERVYIDQSTCPECGTIPTTPYELYTLRRNKKLIVLGLGFVVGSFAIAQIPNIQRNGWASVLPFSIQVRLWDLDDPGIHARVFHAYTNSDLTDTQRRILRPKIVAELGDPANKANQIAILMEYFKPYNNSPSLINFDDIAEALQSASVDSIGYLVEYISNSHVPLEGEIVDIRRSFLDHEHDGIRRMCWNWLAKHPDGVQDENKFREAITNMDDIEFSMMFAGNFNDASDEAQEFVIRLYNDGSDLERNRTADIAGSLILREGRRRSLNPGLYRILLDNFSPDNPKLASYVYFSLESMPNELQPELEELFRETTDEEQLKQLLTSFRKMKEWAVALIPTIHLISNNPEIPFHLRYEAHRSSVSIADRYRSGGVPSPLPIYVDELGDVLNRYDMRSDTTKVRLMGVLGSMHTSHRLASLIVIMERDGVATADQLIRWIEDRPALELLLRVSFEDANSELHQSTELLDLFHNTLTWALDHMEPDPESVDALVRGLEMLEATAEPADPTASAPTSPAPDLAD